MPIPSVGGGYQYNDGNVSETKISVQGAPAALTATATVTTAQLLTGIIAGSPGGSAADYTLPTVALLEATLTNAKIDSSFEFVIINIDGSGSGVITLTAGTGWTLVGLATVAATAGTAGQWRARKTGSGTWTAYRIS